MPSPSNNSGHYLTIIRVATAAALALSKACAGHMGMAGRCHQLLFVCHRRRIRLRLQSRHPYQTFQQEAFQQIPKEGSLRGLSSTDFGLSVHQFPPYLSRHINNISGRTRLFQSMSFSGENGDANSKPTREGGEDDRLKWEKMYYSSTQQKPLFNEDAADQSSSTIQDMAASSTKSEIRVITFDLDNTIWETSATISDANDALANHLNEVFGIEERSEKRMGQLFKQSPNRYAGVDHPEEGDSMYNGDGENFQDGNDYSDTVQNVGESEFTPPTNVVTNGDSGVHIQASFGTKEGGQAKKKPVYLTLLRKDAIRSLILETEGATSMAAVDLEQQVDAAFEVWIEARCQSISRNFAPFAVPTLMNLRSQLTLNTSNKVYIGAITDGNSNPNRVPELAGVFDFVIRAEDVGASKPDKRVYKAAVAALMLRLGQDGRSVEEFFLGETLGEGAATDSYIASDSTSIVSTWNDIEEEAVKAFSEAVGPWWVHVGDDFFKDVVAAKEFQMRTVWTRELIKGSGSNNEQTGKSMKDENEAEKKQRSVPDLINEISKSDGVLKMTIGDTDFLSQSLHEEFSDVILDRFGDLSGVLMEWHEEGKATQSNIGSISFDDDNMGINVGTNVLDTNQSSAAESFGSDQMPSVDLSDGVQNQKFCVFCGEQIPAVAKFCAYCGERQI